MNKNLASRNFDNTKTDFIHISESNLKVILHDYKNRFQNINNSEYKWTFFWGGVFLSLLISCITTQNYNTFKFINSDTIRGIFIAFTIVFFVLTLWSLYKEFSSAKKESIDNIINQLIEEIRGEEIKNEDSSFEEEATITNDLVNKTIRKIC